MAAEYYDTYSDELDKLGLDVPGKLELFLSVDRKNRVMDLGN